MKITTEKFYRISGGSVQLKGVESDIVTPNRFSHIKIGESDEKNPLEWDQIDTIRTFSSFFLPGLFAGILKTFFVEVISKNATVLKIPFHSTDEQALRISQNIVDLIHQKMTH